jgi:Uma2 family endonuclease
VNAPFPKPPLRMSRAEYRRWAEAQPRGRFERVAGEVVAMAPERAAHNRVKARIWRALDAAVRSAGLPCEAFTDGMAVEIGEDYDYEPDALVNCGDPLPADVMAAPNPVVVVEVLSPSTQSTDTGAKLADYFRVPSVQHYLILRADRPQVIHHRRSDDGASIETRVVTESAIRLAPPGIEVAVADFYPEP